MSATKPVAVKKQLTLPTEKTMPKTRMEEYIWLIYGPPKIGKTSFANSFDNAFIMAFEEGTHHLSAYSRQIESFEDVQGYYDLLKNTDHQFKTVVFDTVDILWRMIQDDVCKQKKIEHPRELDYGHGYDLVKSKLLKTLNAFMKLGLGIVMISHAQDTEVKTRVASYTKTTVTLSKAPREIVLGLTDIIAYCAFDPLDRNKRIITFKGNESLDAGARTPAEIQLPVSCEFNHENNFAAVKSCFISEQQKG